MYRVIVGVAGWVIAIGLAVSLYKTDNAATVRNASLQEKLNACGVTVNGLLKRSRAADIEAKAAREAAEVYSKGLHKRADVQIATPAKYPDDMCRSAEHRAREWMEQRGRQ